MWFPDDARRVNALSDCLTRRIFRWMSSHPHRVQN